MVAAEVGDAIVGERNALHLLQVGGVEIRRQIACLEKGRHPPVGQLLDGSQFSAGSRSPPWRGLHEDLWLRMSDQAASAVSAKLDHESVPGLTDFEVREVKTQRREAKTRAEDSQQGTVLPVDRGGATGARSV